MDDADILIWQLDYHKSKNPKTTRVKMPSNSESGAQKGALTGSLHPRPQQQSFTGRDG